MGTDLTKEMSRIPAHIAARMGTAVANSPADTLGDDLSGGLSQGGVPRISLKASRFRIVENGAEIRLRETELDVIIVGANKGLSKTFYAEAWDPDSEPGAPDCWSMDGVYPDASIADPQHDKCGTCPKNQWGSKLTPAGKQIKACADQKRLAVVAASDPGTVYLVQVTPAALQGLAKYNAELKARGLRPDWVITTLSFDSEASFPKLQFAFGGFPSEEALEVVSELEPEAIMRVTTGDLTLAAQSPAQIEKPRAAPAEEEEEEEASDPKPKPKAKAKPKPTPVEEEEGGEEEEAAAPAPKPKPKPKAAPVEEEEEEDDTLVSFSKPKPKVEPEVAAPKRKKPPVTAVLDENDDEAEAPAPKGDKKMASLVDTISSRLGGLYAAEGDEGDEDDGD